MYDASTVVYDFLSSLYDVSYVVITGLRLCVRCVLCLYGFLCVYHVCMILLCLCVWFVVFICVFFCVRMI